MLHILITSSRFLASNFAIWNLLLYHFCFEINYEQFGWGIRFINQMKSLVYYLLLVFYTCTVLANADEQQCDGDSQGNCVIPSSDDQIEDKFSPPTTKIQSDVKIAKGSNEGGKPPEAQLGNCKDRYPKECNLYAKEGECDKNPGWMIVNCPASCRSCHLLDPKKRCDRRFLNISSDPIYDVGDMDRMFLSIPKVFGHLYDIEVVSNSPHIVVFHNFVSDEEIEAILESVSDNWERSTDTGATNEFGETGRILSQSRTSSNAWCRSRCENDPTVQRVLRKIEAVTRVPSTHYESFQILRYEVGQYYRTHHDMGP